MNNKVVTFFRNRDRDSGQTYDLPIAIRDCSDCSVHVYSRKPLGRSALNSGKLEDREAFKEFLNSLRGAVEKAEGGMIVLVEDFGISRRVRVYPVGSASASFSHPARYVALEPDGQPSLHVISGAAPIADLPLDTHLLVPVDRKAEKALDDLRTYLRWYSPDLESLVLHVIRQPSLEYRVGRIESMLGLPGNAAPTLPGGAAGRSEGSGPLAAAGEQLRAFFSGRFVRNLTYTVGGLVALGTIAVVVLRLYPVLPSIGQFPFLSQQSTVQEPASEPGGAHTLSTQQPVIPSGKTSVSVPASDNSRKKPVVGLTAEQSKSVESLTEAVKQMILLFRDADRDPKLDEFWRTHFEGVLEGKRIDQDEQNMEDMLNNPAILWGLFKLQVLSLGGDNENFLNGSDMYKKTKEAYDTIPKDNLDESSIQSFAALACEIGSDADELKSAILQNKSCDDFSLKDATAGLQKTGEYWKNRLSERSSQ